MVCSLVAAVMMVQCLVWLAVVLVLDIHLVADIVELVVVVDILVDRLVLDNCLKLLAAQLFGHMSLVLDLGYHIRIPLVVEDQMHFVQDKLQLVDHLVEEDHTFETAWIVVLGLVGIQQVQDLDVGLHLDTHWWIEVYQMMWLEGYHHDDILLVVGDQCLVDRGLGVVDHKAYYLDIQFVVDMVALVEDSLHNGRAVDIHHDILAGHLVAVAAGLQLGGVAVVTPETHLRVVRAHLHDTQLVLAELVVVVAGLHLVVMAEHLVRHFAIVVLQYLESTYCVEG